jgi:hypothetical protein
MNVTSTLSQDVGSADSRPSETRGSPHNRNAPKPLDRLLQQATVLAKQLQRERAALEGSGAASSRPAVKALEQQLVQLWNAIRAARLSGGSDIDLVRRRYRWD